MGNRESIYGANLNSVTPADGSANSVLVHGTRAYQYAHGHGGVGYYSVDHEALEDVSEGLDDGTYTPIVRLGYVHVDQEALSDRRVTAFLQHYSRHTDSGGNAGDVGNAVTYLSIRRSSVEGTARRLSHGQPPSTVPLPTTPLPGTDRV